ncbi:hypothetical protein [Mesorhizobium caraganae]|uniref:hypothetical protein n=1 Tax=Mesorhizobium caraganae TaxID=483206 RepID=UPI0035E432A9
MLNIVVASSSLAPFAPTADKAHRPSQNHPRHARLAPSGNLPDLKIVIQLGDVLVHLWLSSYCRAARDGDARHRRDTLDVVHCFQHLSLFASADPYSVAGYAIKVDAMLRPRIRRPLATASRCANVPSRALTMASSDISSSLLQSSKRASEIDAQGY